MPPKRKKSVGARISGPQLGEPDRHFKALLSSLSLFQGRGSFTDLILCAEDGKVECHKAMLAPFSPLLRSMFRVSTERQASDVTGISLGGVKVRILQQLIAFIYTGEFGGRGREEVAALADFLQLKVDLQEKEKEGKGAKEANESPATKGASWKEFIAENGASPTAPSPAPGRKRGRPATPVLQLDTPVRKRGKTGGQEDIGKADSVKLDDDEDDKRMKSRAEKMRIGIKVKNLTRDGSREVLKYRDMEAVEEATMMEAALKKVKNGRKSGVEKVEEEVKVAKLVKELPEIEVSKVEEEPRGRGRTVAPLKLTLKKTPEKEKVVEVTLKVKEKEKVKEKVKENVNGNNVFEVERILDERTGKDKKKEYFVKWKGWNSPEDNTWEPEDSLGKSKKLIKEFEKRVEEINKKKVASALGEESDGSDGVEILEEQRTPPKTDLKKGRKSKTVVAAVDDNVAADATSAKKGRKKKGDLDTTLVVETASDMKEKKKKADAEPVDDEYEVEKVLEKRETKSGTEFLVKWKGWEEEKDRTWEPQANLKGSEKLIKKFESSAAKETAPTPPSEEGVALCDVCNRIFLSQDSLKNHSKEHKAKKKSIASATPTPKSKRIKDIVESTPAKETLATKSESAGLECFKCGKECKTKIELKHHVLSHFYPEFYARLPSSKPFSCPICSSVSRDRISLVRHFAFAHEEIYKYCTKEELTNSPSTDTPSRAPPAPRDDSDVEEIGIDKDDPFAGIKDNFEKATSGPAAPEPAPELAPEPAAEPEPEPVKYRPGPKSKKKSLIVTEPAAPAVVPPPWRSETLDDDNEKVYNVDDSDDDDVVPPAKAASNAFSFDDIFGGGSSAPAEAPAAVVEQPVFNKDSDDEGEAYSAVTASVAELMGGSDDEDIFK